MEEEQEETPIKQTVEKEDEKEREEGKGDHQDDEPEDGKLLMNIMGDTYS